MTEDEIREIAILAAGHGGHTWESLPPSSRVRWIAEVVAALNGGQDETTVGQAARRALREFREKPVAPSKVPAKVETVTKKVR